MNDIMKFFGQQVSAESFDQIKISTFPTDKKAAKRYAAPLPP